MKTDLKKINSRRVLITERKNFSENAIKQLENNGFKVDKKDLNYEQLSEIIQNYDGIIIRLGIFIDAKLIEKAKKLSFIATPTTGLDHVDLECAKKNNIEIFSLKNEKEFLDKITPTAELTFALMLALMRKVTLAQNSVLDGVWNRDLFVGEELKNKNLGIIGLGRLGTQVAEIGRAFRMNVAYYDPHKKNENYTAKKTLKELASWADIITIHVHLDETTKNMIDKSFLKNCKPCAHIINTSRGKIINESDLLIALKNKTISGCAVDVLSNEINNKKTISNKLIDYAKTHGNIVITPHIGGATKESMRITEEFVVEKVIRSYVK